MCSVEVPQGHLDMEPNRTMRKLVVRIDREGRQLVAAVALPPTAECREKSGISAVFHGDRNALLD
jgi:hypothetical protein